MNEMVQVPSDLKIGMNARHLKFLLDVAKRAPMLDGERILLEEIEADVATRAANLFEQRRRDLARQEAEDSQRALAEQESRAAASKAEVEKLDAQRQAVADQVGAGESEDKAGESGDKLAEDDTRKPANPKAVSGPASQEKR